MAVITLNSVVTVTVMIKATCCSAVRQCLSEELMSYTQQVDR